MRAVSYRARHLMDRPAASADWPSVENDAIAGVAATLCRNVTDKLVFGWTAVLAHLDDLRIEPRENVHQVAL